MQKPLSIDGVRMQDSCCGLGTASFHRLERWNPLFPSMKVAPAGLLLQLLGTASFHRLMMEKPLSIDGKAPAGLLLWSYKLLFPSIGAWKCDSVNPFCF
jgi:hypothetical protein